MKTEHHKKAEHHMKKAAKHHEMAVKYNNHNELRKIISKCLK